MDNSEKSAIKGFMLPIIAGLAILELITIAVFAVIGKFDLRVVWGALWGSVVMIIYYLLLARAVMKAAAGDPEDAKKRIQASYSARFLFLMIAIAAGLFLSRSFNLLNWIPMMLAIIFPRISITVWQLIQSVKKKHTSDADRSEEDIPDAFKYDPHEPDMLDSELYEVVLRQRRSNLSDTTDTDNDEKESED